MRAPCRVNKYRDSQLNLDAGAGPGCTYSNDGWDVWGVERTEARQGVEPDKRDDPGEAGWGEWWDGVKGGVG